MKNWVKYKLNEVCKIGDGNHSSNYPKSNEMVSKGIPFIRANNMINGYVVWNDMKFITAQKHQILKKGHLKTGDILFTNRGEIGKIAIVGSDFENANLNSQIAWFRCLEKINNRFLFYFLASPSMKNYYSVEKNGAALQQFTIRQINDIEIPIPPLPEQQRIVFILDECFTAIAKAKAIAEQNLKNAQELFESYLQRVFDPSTRSGQERGDGWVISTIGEACKLMTGGTPSTTKKEYYEGGKIKWLVSGDINKKEIFDCEGRITNLGLENSSVRYLPVNSVLIALNGQGKTRGTVAMLRVKATCNQSLVSIYPNNVNNVLPELIYANLDGRYDEIRKLTGDTGNDRRGLNMQIIRNISFSYPKSLEEQQFIVQKLDALRAETQKLEAVYQKKINDLEELKKSILQKAFAGELKTVKAVEYDFKDTLNIAAEKSIN